MERTSLLLALLLALGCSVDAKATEAPSEPWLVLRTGAPDQPHILSVRSSLPDQKLRASFPVQATVRWAYESNETGLPAKEADLKAFYAFEESLRARDPDERVFLQAIRRTGSGVRTWVFFARSEQALRQLVGDNAQITLKFTQDPSWSELATILARTRR